MNEKPRIPFDSWEALNERELTEAERRVMSPAWRLWQISITRMNNYNHAAFRPGELARLVYGRDTKANRHAVKVQMGILAGIEWIAPVCDTGSTPLCVMVSQQIACRGAGKGSRKDVCGEIAHMDMRETIFRPMVAVPAGEGPSDSMKPRAEDAGHDGRLSAMECPGCQPNIRRLKAGKLTEDELLQIHGEAWSSQRREYTG
jgi:hypothetical protein